MPKFTLEGSSTGAVKAVQDLQKAMDKVDTSTQLTAKDMKKLEDAAGRVVKSNEEPQARYNRRMMDLAEQVKRGKLSLEDAEKAAQKYGVQLERAGKHGHEAFGAEAVREIGAYAAGFLGVHKIIESVVEGFRDIERESQAAADSVFQSLGAFGELQQISATPEEFAKNVALARNFVDKGIIPPEQKGRAADLVFGLRSAGLTDQEIQFITELGENKYVKSEGLKDFAVAVKTYQDIFREDAGTFEESAKKIIQASKDTRTNATNTAIAAAVYGSPAKLAGFSDEEANAAFVAILKESASPDIAQVRTARLFEQIYKNKLGKGSLQETLDSLQAQLAAGKSPFDLVKNVRAVAGLSALSNQEDVFQRNLIGISKASGADVSGFGYINLDPNLRAALVKEEAEGGVAAIYEKLDAERESLYDAWRAYDTRRSRESGRGAALFSALAQSTFGNLIDVLGGENTVLEAEVEKLPKGKLRSAIEDYLRRLAESNERMERREAGAPNGRPE